MSQKLITKEIESGAKKYPLYSQDGKGDEGLVWAKYFYPAGAYTLYVTEMEIRKLVSVGMKQEIEGTIFGYVTGVDFPELGYTDMEELFAMRGRFGLGIERDMYFTPCTLGEIKSGEKR